MLPQREVTVLANLEAVQGRFFPKTRGHFHELWTAWLERVTRREHTMSGGGADASSSASRSQQEIDATLRQVPAPCYCGGGGGCWPLPTA